MAHIEASSKPSPWHEGERRMHQRLGVAEQMERFGREVVRNFMPDQHRSFYGRLPLLIVAAVDDAGAPWATLLDGDVLTIPDFAGNLHFNTIGNLLLNPRARLLFFDFESGDLLQLTGSCEIVLEGEEIAAFRGAERLWRFTVSQLVRRRGAVSLRGSFGDYSPNTLLTGSWEEAAARRRAEALRQSWRPFRIARIVAESASIRSFHLEPEDGAGVPRFEAGQYLPIRVCIAPNEPPLIRAYTLSVAPADRGLRISAKRDGTVSQHLHDRLAVGDRIEARAPGASARPFSFTARAPGPSVPSTRNSRRWRSRASERSRSCARSASRTIASAPKRSDRRRWFARRIQARPRRCPSSLRRKPKQSR